MADYLLEVIACSVEDALAAEAGGAQRLELCSRLDLGGLTPPGELVAAVTFRVRLPVRVMVRTNAGFLASEAELQEMERQVAQWAALPIEGLVCGFLNGEGRLDFAALDRVLRPAPPSRRLTLHHAFDAAAGAPAEKFAAVRRHGRADRILSQASPAVLARLSRSSDANLQIIAGGGLTPENLPRWVAQSGCREFHVGRAARTPSEPTAPVDGAKVRGLRQLLGALGTASHREDDL